MFKLLVYTDTFHGPNIKIYQGADELEVWKAATSITELEDDDERPIELTVQGIKERVALDNEEDITIVFDVSHVPGHMVAAVGITEADESIPVINV